MRHLWKKKAIISYSWDSRVCVMIVGSNFSCVRFDNWLKSPWSLTIIEDRREVSCFDNNYLITPFRLKWSCSLLSNAIFQTSVLFQIEDNNQVSLFLKAFSSTTFKVRRENKKGVNSGKFLKSPKDLFLRTTLRSLNIFIKISNRQFNYI